ncbi:MAG TPA: hypothetical protein VK464_13765 [Symbiobacteriaceae bacterium]|nr:hypothetical protein [Symbiobacteriaceae bacterium]
MTHPLPRMTLLDLRLGCLPLTDEQRLLLRNQVVPVLLPYRPAKKGHPSERSERRRT